MSKFSKHIGQGTDVEINGEIFKLKPLTTKYLPKFFKVMKAFSGATEGASVEEALKNVGDDGTQALADIIDATLESSFPDEDAEERQQFGMKYMMTLLPTIIEINSADVKDVKDIEAIKKQKTMEKINANPSGNTEPTPE